MNSNWKINRVGLIDFWYYDDEEFVFDEAKQFGFVQLFDCTTCLAACTILLMRDCRNI